MENPHWTNHPSNSNLSNKKNVPYQNSTPTTPRINSPQDFFEEIFLDNWLVVSTPLKNISQIGSFPQVGVKIKNIWNHHLVLDKELPYLLSKNTLKPKEKFWTNF